ncbi:MAG: peptide-binding protein [Sedimentisphaerales bacterium]|jgi:peptide/nickel transport system substrate-binding protein
MNGRSGVFKFFLFLFLSVIVLFQVLSMIQSDRLYKRLNGLVDRLENSAASTPVRTEGKSTENKSSVFEPYPGVDGDWLVFNELGEPRTLNLITVESSSESFDICQRNIIETLFYYDLDYDGVKLEPVLAESMEVSKDGLEITVKLRKDIWFSDGVPVTADDVLFSYEAIMNPGVDAASVRNYYDNIRQVVKVDDRTVKFILKEFYWKTIEGIGLFYVLPKHIYNFSDPKQFNNRRSDPVGSGPYVFEKWDVGQQIVLRRNDNYWGKRPRINRLVFKFITNSSASLQALRSHDIDMFEPSSEQFFELSKDEPFKKEFYTLSYWDPAFGYSYIGWNETRAFFKDRRVRLAMTYAVNRPAIVEYIQKGYGKIVTGTFYIYGKQNDPNIKPWPYDLEKAKKLLDEAGWIDHDGDGIRDKNGVPFRFKFLYPSGNDTIENIVKMVKDDTARIGIDMIADPIEWSIFLERVNNSDFDTYLGSWGGTIESDPYQLFHSSQIQNRGNNRVGFSNAQADALIEQARRTLDEDKRYALYHQFDRILHEEQPYTFLVTRPRFTLIDKRFENVKVHKLGLDPLEWYVPKEKQRYK